MSFALSIDLRRRVVAAVEEEGLNHRQAAERFMVSTASVSRWRRLAREKGDVRPGPLGGDRNSWRVEAHRAVFLAVFDTRSDMRTEECAMAPLAHVFEDRAPARAWCTGSPVHPTG